MVSSKLHPVKVSSNGRIKYEHYYLFVDNVPDFISKSSKQIEKKRY